MAEPAVKFVPDTASSSGEAGAALTHEGERILFPALPYDMHDRALAAIENEQLQGFLDRATLHKEASRLSALREAFGAHADAVREQAASIRQHTLDHLDHYLECFIDQAESNGTQVHFATDDRQARDIVLDIARREGLKRCVKSKSMVTEEIRLLHALLDAGVETIETDLAEFIIQLDGDAPSHIVTAAVHKDRTVIARAFERELGVDYTEDPEELTMIARRHLRDAYRKADLGVSGGNFLVAQTGGLVLCTNEGNGRFCTTTPRVHVAVVGIEKVLPDLASLSVMLKLLARSSSGQPMTVYTNIIHGPKCEDDADGPEQLHLVLLDNGRTDMLASESREVLRCIRCAACLNTCPVYRKVGGHAYGAVYSGPIGSLVTPLMRGIENYKDLPNASSLCGACAVACPVKIDIPRELIRLRERLVEQDAPKRGESLAYRLWAWSQATPMRYRWAQRIQRVMMRLLPGGRDFDGDTTGMPPRWINKAPAPMAGWTAHRDLPAPAAQSFRAWWHRERGSGRQGGKA